MNYFRCTVGGSGKGNAVTVTCAEEFAGLTITLSKTGKTYTKTCPSTAPYVVTFNGVENGTYTVSCIVDGQTYSETVVVQDISCVLNYGFKWQIWVDTASQLDSSDYDTLDEVLADEKALRELFLEHACVDYMASVEASNADLETIINDDYCAKWINNCDYALDFLGANTVIKALMDEADKYGYGEWALMPQVPKMTSDTAPFGVASASSEYNNQLAYMAFDDNDSTIWHSVNTPAQHYIQIQHTSPICVKKFEYKSRNYETTRIAKTLVLQGSNDGTTFTDIVSVTPSQTYRDTSLQTFYCEDNSTKYLYHRLVINLNSADYCDIIALQFYAWAPKGNVPVMTSNTAPYGAVSGSSANASYPLYNAFDGNDNTNVTLASASTSGHIIYKFTNPVNVKSILVNCPLALNVGVVFTLAYSDDGTNYTDTSDSFAQTVVNQPERFKLANDNGYHLYWKLIRTSVNTAGMVNTLQFYGRELKVSVPKMTSNTAPFGTASAKSSLNSSYLPWKVFDNDASTHWYSNANAGEKDSWVAYEFTSQTKLRMAIVVNSNSDSTNIATAGTINIKNSNDDVIATDTFSGGTRFSKVFEIANDNTGTLFKCNIAGSNGLGVTLTTVQFYGLDYSEKEFEVGTTKKWLYDHGVELETVTLTNTNSNATGAKRFASLFTQKTGTANSSQVDVYCDLTDYSLVACKYGDEIASTDAANAGTLQITTSIPADWANDSNRVAFIRSTLPIYNKTLALDISSVSGTKYVTFGVWTSSSQTKKNEITELWLEGGTT